MPPRTCSPLTRVAGWTLRPLPWLKLVMQLSRAMLDMTPLPVKYQPSPATVLSVTQFTKTESLTTVFSLDKIHARMGGLVDRHGGRVQAVHVNERQANQALDMVRWSERFRWAGSGRTVLPIKIAAWRVLTMMKSRR